MLPSEFYYVARHEARFHVQARFELVGEVDRTPCFAQVEATVVSVFRGKDLIRVGERLCFGVGVTRPGDCLPESGVVWQPDAAFREARFVEVFLNGDPPACEVALSQIMLLDAPSDGPRMRGHYPTVALRHRRAQAQARRRDRDGA